MQLLKDTEAAGIYRFSEDTLLLKFKTDKLVELEHAKEIDQSFMEISQGERLYYIIDAMDVQSNMTSDAQRYFSSQSMSAECTIAAAILQNNLPVRLIATVFLKIYKPTYPSKLFPNLDKALEWFDEIKTTH